LGISPFFTYWAKVRKIQPASVWRPVASVSPSNEIMVSRPQSVNQWYPAMTVRISSPMAWARTRSSWRPSGVMMNWSAASTSSAAKPVRALGSAIDNSSLRLSRSISRALQGDRACIDSHFSVEAVSAAH
jgi:hypothetical protein